MWLLSFFFFFFQAEDGIRDLTVTGVQTCALPIYNVVNRWRRWAERLRARHNRREGARAPGSLVLARGARPVWQRIHHGARTILHVSPHVAITLRALPRPAFGTASTLRVRSESIQRPGRTLGRSHEAPGSHPVAPAEMTPNVPRSSVTFVHARHTHSRARSMERRVERLHDLVDRWRSKPALAIDAAELPRRVRRSAARGEMTAPDQARALPVLLHQRRVGAQSSASPTAEPGESWPARSEPAVSAPAPAAID